MYKNKKWGIIAHFTLCSAMRVLCSYKYSFQLRLKIFVWNSNQEQLQVDTDVCVCVCMYVCIYIVIFGRLCVFLGLAVQSLFVNERRIVVRIITHIIAVICAAFSRQECKGSRHFFHFSVICCSLLLSFKCLVFDSDCRRLYFQKLQTVGAIFFRK
jgi:hypothetical protein